MGQTNELTCEVVEVRDWNFGGPQNTCVMDRQTVIDALGRKISTMNVDLKGLTFGGNKKIKFLPENVNEIFPNLVTFGAEACSLKIITKENFKMLTKLQALHLEGNGIEAIDNNTFEDLASLKWLFLRKNFCFLDFYFTKLIFVLDRLQ